MPCGGKKSICAVAPALLAGLLALVCGLQFSSTAQAQSQLIYFDRADSEGVLSGGPAAALPPAAMMSSAEDDGQYQLSIIATYQTIQNKGRPENRVDIVFLGDGYTHAELSTYSAQVNSLRSQLFTETPLYQYQNYFNVHRVDIISAQSGVDHRDGLGTYRDTALDMEFWCHGTQDTLCISVSKALSAAANAPDADQIVALANAASTGGAAYPFSDLALISGGSSQAGQNLLHQIGHSFANLADEYDTGNWPEYVGAEPAEPNVSALTATQMTEQAIKWYRWLGYNAPSSWGGLVGSHEGAMGYQTKIYRPTFSSKMRVLGQPFNMPSIESFIIETYRHIDPIDDATPAEAALSGNDTLFVVPMQPIGHNLRVEWLVDGEVVGTSKTLRLEDIFELRGGARQVTVNVADETALVRDEESRDRFMRSTRSWTVQLNRSAPEIIEQPADQWVVVNQKAGFSVVAAGGGLRYQWMRNGVDIPGADQSSYTTPFAVRADDQSKYSVRVYNAEGSVVSRDALLSIINRPPTLGPLSAQTMGWKETRTVTLSGNDPDNDPLTYSVAVSGAPAGVASISGNKITLGGVPGGYLGSFTVTAGVTDGHSAPVTRTFTVTMQNRKPSLAPIAGQRVHWNANKTVTLTGYDPDGDSLQYIVEVLGGAPVSAAVSGATITLDPQGDYLGTCQVKATVIDGLNSASQTFNLQVYNNNPHMLPIADQVISRSETARVVALGAVDADGDDLTFTASARSAALAYDLDRTYNFARLERSWHSDLTGQGEKYFQGYHPDTNELLWFAIKPNGELFIWEGSFAKSAKIAALPAAYHLDPSLLFDVAQPDGAVPVSLEVNGGNLTIEPGSHRGSFIVTVRVTDQMAEDETEFMVTRYDGALVLSAVGDAERHWTDNRVQLALNAADADGSDAQQETAFASAIYDTTAAYNFTKNFNVWFEVENGQDTVRLNRLGYNEKHFLATPVNSFGSSYYSIAPHGAVYEHNGSLTARKLLTYLDPVFYRHPELLKEKLPQPAVAHEAETTASAGEFKFSAPAGYVGKVFIETTADNGGRTDTRVHLVDVFNHAPEFDRESLLEIPTFSYKISRGSKELFANDADGDAVTFSAALEPHQAKPYELKQQYGFAAADNGHSENYFGWSERYLAGSGPGGEEHDFFLLPNGELYLLAGGSVSTSELIAHLGADYWENPALLINAAPPLPAADAAVELDGSIVNVETPADYIGTVTVYVKVHDGQAWDRGELTIRFADLAPWLDQLSAINMHWREDSAEIELTAHDPENELLSYAIEPYDASSVYNLSQQYAFAVRPEGESYNQHGLQEKYFLGTYHDGENKLFYILPDGRIHVIYGAAWADQQLIGWAPFPFYETPSLMFEMPPPPSRFPAELSIDGSMITVDPENGFRGPLLLRALVSDARNTSEMVFHVNVYNNAPVLGELSEHYELSWNTTGGLDIALVAADPDGAKDDLAFAARLGSLAHTAHELDQQHHFAMADGDWRYNRFGWGEKHLGGIVHGGTPAEFVILPGGALYVLNESPDGTIPQSELLGRLSHEYFENPVLLFNVVAPQPLPQEISLVVDGDNVIHITAPAGWTGSFDLTAEVTDGNLHDFQTVHVRYANHAPVLAAIGEQAIHWSEEGIDFEAAATDEDGDALTFAAEIYASAELDALTRQWRFQRHASGYRQNENGRNEKYIYGIDGNGATQWFYLLPTGGLYRFDGALDESNQVAATPEFFYHHPEYLFEGSSSYSPDPGFTFAPAEDERHGLSVDGSLISIRQEPGYWGRLLVKVSVSDGFGEDSEVFPLHVYNYQPQQPTYGETVVSWSAPHGERAMTVTQSDSDQLYYTAAAGGAQHRRYTLDQQYDFSLTGSPTHDYNRRGWREKWLVGTAGGEQAEFALLPTGKLLRWNNSLAESELAGWLSAEEFANPALLVNVAVPAALPPVTVTADNGVVKVDPPQGYVGTIELIAGADDSVHQSLAQMRFTFKNHAPELAAIANQQIHVSAGQLDVPLAASDLDNDALSYSAAIISGDSSAATFAVNAGVLRINFRAGYLGTFRVRATVTDGVNSVYRDFNVTVYNTAPVISPIANQQWHWRTTSKSLEVAASDADGDAVTLSAGVFAQYSSLAQAALQGSTLTVTPLASAVPYNFVIYVDAADGWTTTRRTFSVTISNAAPTLASIPSQTVKWTDPAVTVDLSATDADGDPFTYSAHLTSGSGSVSLVGTRLTVTPQSGYLGTLVVQATVSDGKSQSSRSFSVTVINNAPLIKPIENQAMARGDRKRMVRIFVSDADNDALTISAALKAGTSAPVAVAATPVSVNIYILEDFLGTFPVVVHASDGNKQTSAEFNVSIGNWPPTLEELTNRVVMPDSDCFDVPLVARDPDGDALTFTAVPYQTQRWIYELDQKYNFRPASGSYKYNQLGNHEKYIQGVNENGQVATFVIYPTGNFYLWTGRLTNSQFLGRLDISHYDDPSLLFDVADAGMPANVGLMVSGDTLTVCPPAGGFSDKFYVSVSVSDGVDADHGGFLVRLGSSGGGDPVCEVSTTLHNGDFYAGKTTGFVAEGRIGDSATGAGNRTHEVGVSASAAGPFAAGEADNHVWVNGRRTPFSLVYDKVNGVATFEVGGKFVSHRAEIRQPLTDLLLRTKATDASASIVLDGLVLNGQPLPDEISSSAVAGSVNVLQIAGAAVNDGFTLQGYATMRWGQTGYNIVVNGGFEQPLTSTWDIYNSQEITGWDVEWVYPTLACRGSATHDHHGKSSGKKVTICHIPPGNPTNAHTISVGASALSAHLAHGDFLGECIPSDPLVMEPVIEIQRGTYVEAPEGNQVAELDSDCDGPLLPDSEPEYTTVNLSQMLNTQVNKEYDLSFMFRARPGNYGVQRLTVRWNGQEVISDLPAPAEWTTVSVPVVARGNRTLLEFIDTGEANSFGVLLDAVSVIQYSGSEVPADSSLSFQIEAAAIDGKEPCGSGRCENGRVNICYAPPSSSEARRTISVDCGDVEEFVRLGATLGSCPVSGEICEQRQNLVSPTYTLWNSFLGMVNILELVNPTDQNIQVNLSYYSILGQLVHQQPFNVPARGQFDVIVNDFPGFVTDSYGLIRLDFEGGLDGRMMYYRGAPSGTGYDFVFSIALDNSTFGETSVGFNTYQPSMMPAEANNTVANWLNIVNLESDHRTFTVMTYRQDGLLLGRRVIEVPPFGRRDIDGGHEMAGHNVVGMHVIIPDVRTTEYIAHLTRYGGDAPAGFAPSSFRFAFPLVARQGSSKPIYVPISSQFAEFNWLEVVNILPQSVRVAINLYRADGVLLESVDAVLGPNAQQHINAAALLSRGQVGFAAVVPTIPHSIVAQSMFYFRDEATGSITSFYGSQGREGSPCVQSGSYNLFLGMENYAKLINTSATAVQLTVELSGFEGAITKVYTLPARSSLNLPLRDFAEFQRSPDTYGMLRMQSDNPDAVLFGEVLRLGFEPGGNVDFSAPTLVR